MFHRGTAAIPGGSAAEPRRACKRDCGGGGVRKIIRWGERDGEKNS